MRDCVLLCIVPKKVNGEKEEIEEVQLIFFMCLMGYIFFLTKHFDWDENGQHKLLNFCLIIIVGLV